MTKRFFSTILCLALLGITAAFAGCSNDQSKTDSKSPLADDGKVYTTNYPLTYFAERILGSKENVVFLVPTDADPSYWKPSSDDLAKLQGAGLIVTNGAEYEKWIDKVTLPQSKIVDTAKNYKELWLVEPDAITHSHGDDGAHSHAGTATHTWLDLNLAFLQADSLSAGLLRKFPEKAKEIELNSGLLRKDLEVLSDALKQASVKWKDQPVIGSHPVYQYFGKATGVNLKSVHWEPSDSPDEAHLKEIQELLAKHPAKLMVWEDDPTPEMAAKLKELGITSIVIRTCGNRPPSGDFLTEMKANIQRLAEVQ